MAAADRQTLEEQIYAYVGRQNGAPKKSTDDVNVAMIRHWAELMGEQSVIYFDQQSASLTAKGGIVAPPSMLQVWAMEGYPMAASPAQDEQRALHQLFDSFGYTGVLGTNSSTEMYRDLRPGDAITSQTTIDSISEQKATARGIGYFIETVTVFTDQDGQTVGRQVFRVLKFIPNEANGQAEPQGDGAATPALPVRIPSPRGQDNGWWWEAVDAGKVLIQRCQSCATLRHPPRPMCGQCQSVEWDSIESALAGEVYSFTTLYHPKVPGYHYPLCCAVIELAEGTRLVANLVGIDHQAVTIGMKVQGKVEQVDDKTMLPQFYPD